MEFDIILLQDSQKEDERTFKSLNRVSIKSFFVIIIIDVQLQWQRQMEASYKHYVSARLSFFIEQ